MKKNKLIILFLFIFNTTSSLAEDTTSKFSYESKEINEIIQKFGDNSLTERERSENKKRFSLYLKNKSIGVFKKYREQLDYYPVLFSEKRQKLQDIILERILSKLEPLKKSLKPHVIFTAGVPGVGKSYSYKKYLLCLGKNIEEYFLVDPDQIKNEIPEYLAKLNESQVNSRFSASYVHRESSYLSYIIRDVAIEEK